jgi:hypothetical protein
MFHTKSRIEIAGRLNRVGFVAADAVFIIAVLNMYPNTQIENRPVSLLNIEVLADESDDDYH